MLRDRYPAVDLFARVPALHLTFEPVLARLDTLLDDDVLFQAVKADLSRRRPRTRSTGRYSTPVEVILRLLIVKRLSRWSYADTEHFVHDSLTLRQFCRLGVERVPDDTTLLRWAALRQPETLQTLLDQVVALARQLQVTRGRKLRGDSTVVQSAIDHPTDSSLLVDRVRTLGRLIRRARPAVADQLTAVHDAFRTRTRRARRHLQTIHRLARRHGEAAVAAQREAYGKLCRIARPVVRRAERVQAALAAVADPVQAALAAVADPAPRTTTRASERVQKAFVRVLPLAHQVIAQAERRVLRGAAVPATEKVVSLVEPHTAIIPRPKAGHTVELGRTLWLGEVEGGIITAVQVLDGAPPDSAQVLPSLAHHPRQFGRPPDLLTADRGCSTPTLRQQVAAAGGRRVALPHTGRATPTSEARERQPWFRRGYRWRAGIEGRIGVLQQRYGWARCPDHGDAGVKRWAYLGVLTANLVTIARATAGR
jgi:IS5 family transposase